MQEFTQTIFLLQLEPGQIIISCLLFMWAGFVRSGLGFGGAALGLPLMLLVHDQPLFWLPVIGFHLLFFSGLTLRTRIHNVDWSYLQHSSVYIIPAALIGVFGLLNLPNNWILIFIYSVTMFYGLMWLLNWTIKSQRGWLDKILLTVGGYVAGTSLTGAPLMVAVYTNNVARNQLRDTLFVLWFALVSIKMTTFAVMNVDLHFFSALLLLPVAAIGHIIGLKAHEYILQNNQRFKQIIGAVLIVICAIGIWPVIST